MFEELNGDISHLGIKKAVIQLKNEASAGQDLFLNICFKFGSDTMMKSVYTLLRNVRIRIFSEK